MSEGSSSGSAGSSANPSRSCNAARKESAVQPCCKKRNFSRARSRFWRSTLDSRKSSATPRTTGTACSHRTKAFKRTPRCGSVESPPATRKENPTSDLHFGFAKEFGDTAHNRNGLFPPHESVQTHAKMRIGGKSAGHAQRKSNFRSALWIRERVRRHRAQPERLVPTARKRSNARQDADRWKVRRPRAKKIQLPICTLDSRKSSATPRTTGTACSHRTKAFKRTPRCGSVESPPATRKENPTSSPCKRFRVTAVSPTSLISGYVHHERQPVIETLNLRGRL